MAPASLPDRPRLVLVGAGHAHLQVLKALAEDDHPPVDLTVVSPVRRHLYSGMVPGFLQGTYSEDEISFDLPPLVTRAGGRLVDAWAVGLDPAERTLRLEGAADGSPAPDSLPYDLVSFNVGSRSAATDRPGVAEHAALVKPIDRVAELAVRVDRLARRGGHGRRRVAVVGAGAAGVEVALAIDAVLSGLARERKITLYESGPEILGGYSHRVRHKALEILAERGITVAAATPVQAVGRDWVETVGGARRPADLTVWITGAAAPPLFRGSGLPLDEDGYLLVSPSLRSIAEPSVFAVGDCATLLEHPKTPKAGVYAVRQGPVLWQSLLAALGEGHPPTYDPQSGFLSILNTADGKALVRYRGIVSHSAWGWKLKDWIDRRFMDRFGLGT
jgi:selenide,water dikinase